MHVHAGNLQLTRTLPPAPALRLALVGIQGESGSQRVQISFKEGLHNTRRDVR